MHDDLTLHDFNAFMYSYLEPQYMVFNVKTICTIESSLATLSKFLCIKMVYGLMILYFEALSLLRKSSMQQ